MLNAPHLRLRLAGLCLVALSAVDARAEFLSQNFDTWNAFWSPAPGTSASTNSADGWFAKEAWVSANFVDEPSSPNAIYLANWSNNTGTDGSVRTPFLLNGIGRFVFWTTIPSGTAGTSFDFEVQKSADGASWSTVTTIEETRGTPEVWTEHTIAINEQSPVYVRIVKSEETAPGLFLGIDSVSTEDPPAAVTLSTLVTDPDVPLHNDNVELSVSAVPTINASNLTLTAWYRVGDSGPFSSIAMQTNASPTNYKAVTPIPGQLVGSLVEYYVEASFEGFEAQSPTNSPVAGASGPASYVVSERPFDTGFSAVTIIDAFNQPMNLIEDFTWEGVADALTTSPSSFRFSGASTNEGVTNVFGDVDQVFDTFVVRGTAGLSEAAATIQNSFTGQVAFTFSETNGAYEARQAVFNNFDTWPDQASYAATSNDGWFASSAKLEAPDAQKKLRGKPIDLAAGAYLRTPEMPDGIGHIKFWYRHGQADGSPATSVTIEKSITGGSSPSEWVSVGSVADITVTNYLRSSTLHNDRNYRFLRLRNSGSAPVLIEEALVYYAAAGTRVNELQIVPTAPTATNTVTPTVRVEARTGASNVTVTLFHTDPGNTFQSIGMTNRGDDVFVPVSPIPAAQGTGPDGTGPVRYYVQTSFEGFEAPLASPMIFPAGSPGNANVYTNANASIVASNPTITPDPPTTLSPTGFGIDITPSAGATNLGARVHYRIGNSGGFSSISMTGETQFATISDAGPFPIPGSRLEYYYELLFEGPNAVSPVFFPAAGAAAPIATIVRKAFSSPYTNMTLGGTYTSNMLHVADHLWQRVIDTSPGIADAVANFSSGGTTWGDANQLATSFPVFGTAEPGGANIQISGTHTAKYAHIFNSDTLEYNVQQADYTRIDDWTGAATYGTRSNPDGWEMGDARTTSTSAPDLARLYGGAGRSLVLRDSSSSYLRSPIRPQGIGELHLLYRAWETNGLGNEASTFHIQKSADGSNWLHVDSVTNILSTDYCHYSLRLTDRNFFYVRILNDTNAGNHLLMLDEIFVTDPGAGVTFSNLVQNPLAPAITNTVDVSVDIFPLAGASNLTATLWYRGGSLLPFEPVAMTNLGDTFASTIPRGPPGEMQYYVSCTYDGFGAAVASFPPGGADTPFAYTNTIVEIAEGFDTWNEFWAPAPSTTGSTNTPEGWFANEAWVSPNFPNVPSAPNALYLANWNNDTGTDGYLRSPLMANGVGAIAFWTTIPSGTEGTAFRFEVQKSSDGASWSTVQEFDEERTNPELWQETTIILNDTNSIYLRIVKTEQTGPGIFLGLDDVRVTFLPSTVEIRDIMHHVGYPSSNDDVRVSCYVEAQADFIPAINITGNVFYRTRPRFGSWSAWSASPLSMERQNDDRYFSEGFIPRQPEFTDVEYYVRASFNGYSGIAENDHSPTYSPAGAENASINPTQGSYFVAPATGHPYAVSRFRTSFGQHLVNVDGIDYAMRLYDDYTWQAAVTRPVASSNMTFLFKGVNQYTNSSADGYTTLPSTYGDTDAWKDDLPLAAYGGLNQVPVGLDNGTLATGASLIMRWNEKTGYYEVRRGLMQNFNDFAVQGDYNRIVGASQVPFTVNFDPDTWDMGVETTTRVDFEEAGWTNTIQPNGHSPASLWNAFNAKVQNERMITDTSGAFDRFLVRPRFSTEGAREGVGTLTYNYGRDVQNTNRPIDLFTYISPSNVDYRVKTSWQEKDLVRITEKNVRNRERSVVINSGFDDHVIVFQSLTNNDAVRIDWAELTSWHATTQTHDDWIAAESWVTSSNAYLGSGYACEFDATRDNFENSTNQWLRGPRMETGVGWISFKYTRGDNNPVKFKIQYAEASAPETWLDVTNLTEVTYSGAVGTYQLYSEPIQNTNDVYVRILHTSGSLGRLFIDDVRLDAIVEGETWEANNVRVTDTGGEGARVLVEQTGFLNNGSSNQGNALPPDLAQPPHVKTPSLPNGLGELSFFYREHTPGGTPGRLTIEGSNNLLTWDAIFSFDASTPNGEYQYFSTQLFNFAYSYIRIANATVSSDRVSIDDIVVAEPLAAGVKVRDLALDPVDPYAGIPVHATVTLFDPFLDPSNVTVSLHYRTGTNYWATWAVAQSTELVMEIVTNNPAARTTTYKTVTPIPPQPADTVVQYYAKIDFDGKLDQFTTPFDERKFEHPNFYAPINFNDDLGGTNSIPYYIVFSAPSDAVWFNEVDPWQDFGGHENDYVELAGWAGANLDGWEIEVYSPSASELHSYTITNNTVLADETVGHGFWVLGKSPIPSPPRDQTIPSEDDLSNSSGTGGLRLNRTYGIYQDAICYGTLGNTATLRAQGFRWIGEDPFSFVGNFPLSAEGTGNTPGDFPGSNWTISASASIGAVNPGQTLTLPPFNNPVLLITSPHGSVTPFIGGNFVESGTNVTVIVTEANVVSASNATYTVVGWAGTGSAPSSGLGTNTGPFTVSNDTSVGWIWDTNFWLSASSAGNGTVNMGSGYFDFGTNLTITPTPASGYAFSSWTGPGVPGGAESDNPLLIQMDQPRVVIANFALDTVPLGSNDVQILSIVLDTNVCIMVTGTNGWTPTPWASTNLADTNAWSVVPSYDFSYTNGAYKIWFPFNGGAPKQYYYIRVTDAP